MSDGGTLTSPMDTIKGEVKFAWLELGLGWVGEGVNCPLNHCLSWSKALSPPLAQRSCGAGGTTQHHPFIPTGPWDGLLASTRWVQGWTPKVQGKPWFGSPGEVSELYKRAWDLGTSFLCKPLHPRKAVWGLVSSVSLRGRTEPRVCPVPPSARGALSESVPVRETARELLRKEETGFQEVSGRNRPKGNFPWSSPALSLPAFCRGQDRPD